MTTPIAAVTEIRLAYCVVCWEPARVGAVAVKGWPHTPAICPRCLREMATQIELNGTSPERARVAETVDG